MSKKKEVKGTINLIIKAGEATPSPLLGPALGSKGLNTNEFCKAFNAQTENLPNVKKGTPVKVIITYYTDNSFVFKVKSPPVTVLIKLELNLTKGSSVPNKDKVAKITRAQLEKIAKIKWPDLTASTLDAAVKTIIGSANSMGVQVVNE